MPDSRQNAVRISGMQVVLLLTAVLILATGAASWARYSQRRTTNTVFELTIPNKAVSPGKAPQGMMWIPGGEFSMGAQQPPDRSEVGMRAMTDSRPVHRVYVDGFFMDATDVTN